MKKIINDDGIRRSYLILAAVFVVLLVIVFVMDLSHPKSVPSEDGLIRNVSPIPTYSESDFRTIINPQVSLKYPFYSPDKELIISLRESKINADSYEISLDLNHKSLPLQLYVGDDEVSDFRFWRGTVDASQKQYVDYLNREANYITYEEEFHSVVAWAPSGNAFALYLPDKIMVFSITQDEKLQTERGNSYTRKIVRIVSSKEYGFSDIGSGQSFYPELFFSGDSKEVYFANTTRVVYRKYRLTLETGEVDTLDLENVAKIFPIPGSSGYTYWTDLGNERILNVYDGQTLKTYDLNVAFDYEGKILLSPSRDKVCFENGSSGYSGYSLYNLTTLKSIADGEQYSYCSGWLDNQRISLIEKPYSYPSYTQYFIYNTETNTKQFVSQERNRN
jgi:hypothetical protein